MNNMNGKKISVDRKTVLAGWLIDGSGESVKENVEIQIQNGHVIAVEPWIPGIEIEGEVIDLRKGTILPPLVDAHTHLFMSGTSDLKIRKRKLDAPFDEIKDVIAFHIAEHLSFGVIAVRDGGDHHAHVLRYKNECMSEKKSRFRLQTAGRAWHRSGRYGRLIGRGISDTDSLAESIAKENAEIDHVKIVNSGLNSLIEFGHQTAVQFNLEEMKGAVNAAACKGLSVMVHANGKIPVGIAIEAGCHSIEHGFFMGHENLKKMADKGIFWIPTAATMQAYSDHLKRTGGNPDVACRNLEHQMEQIIQAQKFGVPIAVGTDAGSIGVHHGRGILQELKILQQAGLTIQDAIGCATKNGSKLLNLPASHVLTKGQPADFIAVKGSPDALPDSLFSIETICVNGDFHPLNPRNVS